MGVQCVACQDTFKNSKGDACTPCVLNGYCDWIGNPIGESKPRKRKIKIKRKKSEAAEHFKLERRKRTKARLKAIHGDCIEWIPKAAAKVGGFDFIFADPPFNIGQNYTGYEDLQPEKDFQMFIWEFVQRCWRALKPNGVMCLHGPDYLAERYLIIGMEMKWKRIAWINWHYRFGQHQANNWIDSRCHCLVYAKGATHTFNADAVMVPSDRASKYDDPRTQNTETPGMRLPLTVWGIPSDGPYWGRVQGNNVERQKDCPNQLPEVYLERLIRAYTNVGDTVLDPFGGSGTTAVVANALNRNVVTIDVSSYNVNLIIDRVKKGAVRV